MTSQAHASHNSVPEHCEALYKENGAVPFSDTCFVDAATSSTGLSNFGCTAVVAVIEDYCGTLAHFDEEDTEGTDDGASTGAGEDEEDTEGTDEGASTGADDNDTEGTDEGEPIDAGEENTEGTNEGEPTETDEDITDSTDTQEENVEIIEGISDGEGNQCEYGLANFETGACPAGPTLEEYTVISSGGGSDLGLDCGETREPEDNIPGPVIFTTQGLQFLEDTLLSNAANIASGITAINLVNAYEDAQQTGEMSPMFSQIYDLVLPLLPGDNPIRQAFEDFAQFIEDSDTADCN